MNNLFLGIHEIKAWDFPESDEIDIEIWRDDNWVTTLTINTLTGLVIHHAIKD